MSTAYGAKNYVGNAPNTTLAGALDSSSTSFNITDGTSWPTSNFSMVIDPGTSSEEMVFVGTRTNNALSSVVRGEDSTSAVAHSNLAVCRHDYTAQDAQEANKMASVMTTNGDLIYRAAGIPTRLAVGASTDHVIKVVTGAPAWGVDPVQDKVTTAGDLLYGSAADVLSRLGVGTPGQVLAVNAGATAPTWVTRPSLLDNDATDTTVSNSAVITTLTSLDIPAGDAAAGVVYRATFIGYAVQNNAAALTFTFSCQLNTVDIGGTIVSASASSAQATQYPFIITATVCCTSTSAQVAYWDCGLPNVAAFIQDKFAGQRFAAMTQDMTGASTIRTRVTMSVANASDTCTILHAFLERLA